jgi:type 1 fimbria pilin
MNVPELFQVQGAEGIALRLRDASGNTLRPGTAGAPLFMNPGDNTLMFTVAVERTAAPLLANSYRATLDFHLHYQ